MIRLSPERSHERHDPRKTKRRPGPWWTPRWNLPLKQNGGVRGALLYKEGLPEPIGSGVGIEEPQRGIMHSFGIVKELREQGLAHLVTEHAFAEIRRLDLRCVVGALAKEGSTQYDEVGGEPSRRYALNRNDTTPLAGGA